MKQKITILSLLFLISSVCLGQDAFKDEVILKSKGILVCKILEYVPDSHVLIQFRQGDEQRIPADKIKRVKMHNSVNSLPFDFKPGWHFKTTISLLTGESADGYSISQSALYHKSRWLGIGMGIGLDNYYGNSDRNIIPVFLEGRSFLTDHKTSPFVGVRAGYGFAKAAASDGQVIANPTWMINPQIGFRISGVSTTLEVYGGLKYQKAEYVYHSSERTRTEDILFKRLELGIAISF